MWHLVGRTVHHGSIVPEDVLNSIAVVNVEIDDDDALGAMGGLRMPGGDPRVIEEAEAHRRRGFRVVPGRTRGDEGVARLPGHHLVDCEHRPAGRSQGGLESAGRHRSVGVDRSQPELWLRRPDRLDIVSRVDALDGGDVRARRGLASEQLEDFALQGSFDGAEPVRPFGMTFAHVVHEACRVADEQGGQYPASYLG